MASFMKKAKPELIVRKIAKAQLENSLLTREKSGCPTCPTPVRSANDCHGYAVRGTDLLQFGNKAAWVFLTREGADSCQRSLKPLWVPCITVDSLAFNLTL